MVIHTWWQPATSAMEMIWSLQKSKNISLHSTGLSKHLLHMVTTNHSTLDMTLSDIARYCPLHYSDERISIRSLTWRHNDRDSVSNHQPHGCLLNRLFRRISKKTSKLHVTGLCAGNSPGPVNYPHIGPVTRKMFPFDDVIVLLN